MATAGRDKSTTLPVDLFSVAKKGDYKGLVKLTKKKIDLNSTDIEGQTALHKAVQGRHHKCVERLLFVGANANIIDKYGKPAVVYATTLNDGEKENDYARQQCLTLLIKHTDPTALHGYVQTSFFEAAQNGPDDVLFGYITRGTNVNTKDENGCTPLILAAEQGAGKRVRMLIQAEADVNEADNKKQTALMMALKAEDEECIRMLIEADADVYDPSGSALFTLFRRKQSESIRKLIKEKVQKLIESGTDVNIKDDHRNTALMFAARNGFHECVEFVKGTELESANDDDKTALFLAAENGQTKCVEELINQGADTVNYHGNQPLYAASEQGHTDCLELLIDSGAEIDSHENPQRQTALIVACDRGHAVCVQLLIDAGANINSNENRQGQTPLEVACEKDHGPIVELLRDAGAFGYSHHALTFAAACGNNILIKALINFGTDVNANSNGKFPLQAAAESGLEKSVELLLENGANVNLKDAEGLTALSSALLFGHTVCAETLIKAGADVNANPKNGKFPLQVAAESAHEKLVKLLLENGANVNMKDTEGLTALSLALMFRHADCAETLIKAGADVNTNPKNGKFPLQAAAESGHETLIKAGADVNLDTNGFSTFLQSLMSNSLQCVQHVLKAGAAINKVCVDDYSPSNMQYYLAKARPAKKQIAILAYAAGEKINCSELRKMKMKFQNDEWSTFTEGLVECVEVLNSLEENEGGRLDAMCRKVLRGHLLQLNPHEHLFDRIPHLPLEVGLKSFLLFGVSLEDEDKMKQYSQNMNWKPMSATLVKQGKKLTLVKQGKQLTLYEPLPGFTKTEIRSFIRRLKFVVRNNHVEHEDYETGSENDEEVRNNHVEYEDYETGSENDEEEET